MTITGHTAPQVAVNGAIDRTTKPGAVHQTGDEEVISLCIRHKKRLHHLPDPGVREH